MPSFRYVGELERYYPDCALTVNPGDEADWDAVPDIYWEPISEAPATALPEEVDE